MTPIDFASCVHPRQTPRFLLALLIAVPGALLVLGLTLATNGLLAAFALLLAFLIWFGFEVFYALLIANWVLVSEHNYPRLATLLEEMKSKIGVKKPVDMVVYQRGEFNAAFATLFSRRAIFINSHLLEEGVTDDELRWLIGRFVGQVRAKRRMGLFYYVIEFVQSLQIFNLFILPYERATVYTGDRIALAAIDGDISSAIAALNKLIVGRAVGYSVNPAGLARQYRRVKGSLFGFLARIGSPFPHNIARYVDLIGYAERAFPAQYEAFAAMNPSFQVAGGAMPLVRATVKSGDAGSNMIGWGLLAGAAACTFIGAVTLSAQGPFFGILDRDGSGFDWSDPFGDERRFELAKARQDNTYAGWKGFAQRYPRGNDADQARAAMRRLDLSGAWVFQTAVFNCAPGQCMIRGKMQINSTPSGFTCQFDVYENQPYTQVSAKQRCQVQELSDGLLVIESEVISTSVSGEWAPDNFEITRGPTRERMSGHWQAGSSRQPVTFVRGTTLPRAPSLRPRDPPPAPAYDDPLYSLPK
jgi:hypothetical protein